MGTPHTQSGWLLERRDTPHGNFEVIFGCPSGTSDSNGLTHYWSDNHSGSPSRLNWVSAEQGICPRELPGPFLGTALIFSTYDNLEAIVTQTDNLVGHLSLVGIWGAALYCTAG